MRNTSEARPRASILLLAYNQAHTVEQAAESCFAQRCEPLEIVLSDDASSDDTFARLRRAAQAYRGPHTVVVRRNEANVGVGEHYNQLLAASQGELLITAAGDDVSTPDRVARLLQAWDAQACRADLIASHLIDMDPQGALHDVIRVDDLAQVRSVHDWTRKRPYIVGAGHAFTRRIMERFGPLGPGVFYEDQVMVFRAIASGGAITVDAPLVHYRRGGTSGQAVFDSAQHMRWWKQRRSGRERAEMEQLLADARTAGCEAEVGAHLATAWERVMYLERLSQCSSTAARWQTFRETTSLPSWWRLRKLLHVQFPQATHAVTQSLLKLRPNRR